MSSPSGNSRPANLIPLRKQFIIALQISLACISFCALNLTMVGWGSPERRSTSSSSSAQAAPQEYQHPSSLSNNETSLPSDDLVNTEAINNLNALYQAQQTYLTQHGHYFPDTYKESADLDDINTQLGLNLENGNWQYSVAGYTDELVHWVAQAQRVMNLGLGQYRILRISPEGNISCFGTTGCPALAREDR